MSKRRLKVSYKCLHPSCHVFCKKGELLMEEAEFNRLSHALEEDGTFRSPRDACRLGYAQAFSVVSVEDVTDTEDVAVIEADSELIGMLKAEHEKVIEKLNLMKDQISRRDMDGLWMTTAALNNDIMLHSIKKEETVLFPAVEGRIPMGYAIINIMKEDHRELLSFLHNFRIGLQEGDIHNSISNSLLMNLKNHIDKENVEFFVMASECLDAEEQAAIFEKMLVLEKAHLPEDPGKRTDGQLEEISDGRRRMAAQVDEEEGAAGGCCD